MARVVYSCPPCSVCEDGNAVATLSTSLPLLPQFPGKVEEQLRLRRDVAEPARRPKGDAVGPLGVLKPRIRGSCSISGAVLAQTASPPRRERARARCRGALSYTTAMRGAFGGRVVIASHPKRVRWSSWPGALPKSQRRRSSLTVDACGCPFSGAVLVDRSRRELLQGRVARAHPTSVCGAAMSRNEPRRPLDPNSP